MAKVNGVDARRPKSLAPNLQLRPAGMNQIIENPHTYSDLDKPYSFLCKAHPAETFIHLSKLSQRFCEAPRHYSIGQVYSSEP